MKFQLSSEAFHKVNSFYTIVNTKWEIMEVGPAMQKLAGQKELSGSFFDHFNISRSPLVFKNNQYILQEDTIYFVNLIRADIRLKGQVIPINEDCYMLACTPLIDGLKDIGQVGLNLTDFPLQDYFTDAMFLLRANDKTMTELREYSDTVKQQNLALKEAQKKLEEANTGLEETVRIRTSNLLESNENLKKTLKVLKEAQDQLIESEKMAALGQLVSGIAHEINTPIGAIKAAVDQLETSVNYNLENDPRNYLSLEEWKLYKNLLKDIQKYDIRHTPRESRKKKKAWIEELISRDWRNADVIVNAMAELGFFGNLDNYRFLLQRNGLDQILESIFHSVVLNRMTHVALNSVNKADRVVGALKGFIESEDNGQEEWVDIDGHIEEVLDIYSNLLKGVELEKTITLSDNKVLGVSTHLKMVFSNIIHNSLQALENNGKLCIEVISDDEYQYVRITDNGPGIPEEIQSKIFDPFFTTKKEGHGTGLGLNLVKKIIQRHEGKVSFVSKPGETTFTVSLPIKMESALVGSDEVIYA